MANLLALPIFGQVRCSSSGGMLVADFGGSSRLKKAEEMALYFAMTWSNALAKSSILAFTFTSSFCKP